ncbi:MAG TPA: response regulator [Actinocrinis sp.]|nr:response regulator [Actinocrinis sp.]
MGGGPGPDEGAVPITVLVVDDDFRVNQIHTAYTRRVEGFEVVGQARTAAEALRMAEELAPDLVLMDQYLPDGNGLDVVRDLLAASEPPDVLVITAARDIGSVRGAMKLGAVGYLVKPFGFPVFAQRLAAYRDLRARVEAFERDAEADQVEVDALFGAARPGLTRGGNAAHNAQSLPKGHSAPTFALVQSVLIEAKRDVSAAEVAQLTGISRPTAQRYLALLVKQGVARLDLRYGATGRPEHRYRPA